nr:hypothetical protein [Flexilinea flocculi]
MLSVSLCLYETGTRAQSDDRYSLHTVDYYGSYEPSLPDEIKPMALHKYMQLNANGLHPVLIDSMFSTFSRQP